MPTRSEVEEALKDGDLDEGMPEVSKRLEAIGNVKCDEDVLNDIANKYPLSIPIPLVMLSPHQNLIVAIADEDTHIMNRRTLVLLFMDTIHGLWEEMHQYEPDLKYPISPLIAEWFKIPVQIEPSRKQVGILPISMRTAGALGYLPGFAPEEAPLGNQEAEGMPPSFALAESTIIPSALVQTWTAGGGKMVNRVQGVPVSLRIWFGLLTSITHEARRTPGRKRIEMTLRDLRNLIYLKLEGERYYFDPKRDIERLRANLWEVDQIRIRTILPGYKAPGLWRPVGVTLMPVADLDSPIIFDIELPPGSVGGAMIDRSALRYFGTKSALKYAAAIGLPYYWDKYGTHRHGTRPIQATRPRILRTKEGLALGADEEVLLNKRDQPVAGFNDDRLMFLDDFKRPVQGRTLVERRRLAARERNPYADRYPVLLNNDMLTLCYPADAAELTGNLRYQRLTRAKRALRAMEKVGYCVIEPAEGKFGEQGYRILPTDWSSFSQA